MCEKTATALKVLLAQPDRGGLSEAAAMVFEQVIEDTKKIEGRLSKLEMNSEETKAELLEMKTMLKGLVDHFQAGSWLKRFWDSYGNKITLTALGLIAAIATKYAIPEIIELWKAFN